MAPPSATRTRVPVALGAIVALAAALRLATLGTWPLWIDEAFTLHDAHDVVPSYPLGYWMTAASARVLGDSEFDLRLVPCLFGIATVLLVGTRRHPEGEPGQRELLPALLLALSSWHVFWSQSVRYYAPLVFFLVAAGRALDVPSPGPRRLGLAAACAVLAVLCHPSAAFFLPGVALLALRGRTGGWLGGRAGRWALAGVVAASAFAVARYGWLVEIHLRSKGAGSPWQFVSSYGFQAGPVLLAVAALGLWTTLERGRRRGPTAALTIEVCLGVLPGLLLLGASCLLFVSGYHAIGTLPFVLMLAARGVRSPRLAARPALAAVVMAALVLEQVAGLVLYHSSHGMRPRHREAAEIVRADPGAAVYATREEPLAYYLSEGRRVLRDPPEARPLEGWLLDDFAHAAASAPVTWAVVHPDDLRWWSPDERERFTTLLGDARPVVLQNGFGPKELTLRLYRLEGGAPVRGVVR